MRSAFREDLGRDLQQAVRRLVRDPRFSLTTVATLAIGIGVMAAVFALVNVILLRPLPYPESGRLVAVRHAAPGIETGRTGLSPGTYLHYQEHNRAFEDIATYVEEFYTVSDPQSPELVPERVRVVYVTPNFFSVLRLAPALGRFPTAADFEFGDPEAAFISYDLWVRRFGADSTIVGRSVEIDGRPALVTGVAPSGVHFPHAETQAWLVWAHDIMASRGRARAGIHYLTLSGVGRLKPGFSSESAERDLDQLVNSLGTAQQ